MKQFNTLKISIEDSIAVLAFNRPKALNTLTLEMIDEIREAFEFFEKSDDVRGIIVTGEGNRSFMGGADLKAFIPMGPKELREFAEYGHEHICNYIENFPKPTVAAVNGYCFGGGTELAQLCDIRIASTNAVFAQPEATLGIMPLYLATKRLQRLVGFGRAKELIMTGRWVKADEALQIGLVTSVVEPEELISKAKETLKMIINNSPLGVYYSKLAINRTADVDIHSAGEIERGLASLLFGTEDKKEGIDAFLSRRKPHYKGC